MRVSRTPLLALALTAPLAALSSCSSSDGPAKPSDPVLAQGYDVYQQRCASCHGNEGQGGAGLNLQQVETRLTEDEQIQVVTNGRSTMPKFAGVLTPEEIEAVVRYEREEL